MSSIFIPPPEPKSALGYLRMLSPTAAVRVSPLCLGAMNFGDEWKEILGECSQETSNDILDYFYDRGGNFIDTANNYQHGQSEKWVGEWMKQRGVRDEMVISTKYTTAFGGYLGKNKGIIANTGGNGAKSLHLSLARSLENLQTDYIDLLYIHWWDFTTSIPELMHALNDVIAAGKVLYIGVSDTPAWIVAKANQYARDHGLRQFCVYQGRWSAAMRDFERDIIPMVQHENMSFMPWGTMGGGTFKTEEQRKVSEGRGKDENSPNVVAVTQALEKIAKEKNTLITSVALAYVMQKVPYVFPIVGGRKVDHIKGNIEALSLELTKEEVAEIEGATPFDIGFPLNLITKSAQDSFLNKYAGHIKYVEVSKPIPPHKK
ncbi:NADP-dependent oxidoreductase domain-containing protein [Calycina marina]|uniref:NADP-dependent oxidoreductase domain-containing protein n=1 Tax=Calycina marina TaxID=1763456 RepID=A0A9P7Z9G0_9HELO|nr:NADP-dependent oxidoreductase domain-containing protein [Calycina marina]